MSINSPSASGDLPGLATRHTTYRSPSQHTLEHANDPPSSFSSSYRATSSPPVVASSIATTLSLPVALPSHRPRNMPTLPSTYAPRDADDDLVHACGIHIGAHDSSGPTPDPDLDDLVLVPVVTGDGVGAITSPSSLAAENDQPRTPSLKPRLSLSNLSLHSPSSILGTPFDVSSPRFEYPFPCSSGISEPELTLPHSMFFSVTSSFMPSAPPPPSSLPRSETHTARGYSPTHPRHHHRDPPVPPTLAKKRKSVSVANPPQLTRRRTRSSSQGGEATPTNNTSGAPKESRGPVQRRFASEGPESTRSSAAEERPGAEHFDSTTTMRRMDFDPVSFAHHPSSADGRRYTDGAPATPTAMAYRSVAVRS